jgi:hypothetical protein
VRSLIVIRSCFATAARTESTIPLTISFGIEKRLCVTSPANSPGAELFQIAERFYNALTGKPIQGPKYEHIEVLLARGQHHLLELNSVLLAAAGNGVAELVNDCPSLPKAKLPELDQLVPVVLFVGRDPGVHGDSQRFCPFV